MTEIAAQVQTDDRTLLDQFLNAKSNGAFEQLVRRYVDLVYATSLRRVRDRHLAEDVTQAVFIVLFQRASNISSSTPLPAWLHRTACYASSNAIKMQTRRTQHEEQAAAEVSAGHPIAAIDDSWREIEPALDDALNRLPTADRSAVLLRYYQDQSVEQTARALNITNEAAKKRLQRALQKLRGILSSKGISTSTKASRSAGPRTRSRRAPRAQNGSARAAPTATPKPNPAPPGSIPCRWPSFRSSATSGRTPAPTSSPKIWPAPSRGDRWSVRKKNCP
ncbi:MAG: sigma-70 family RNA polymerase sigma factor [Anaerolineae bacterium]|nr:sigma-70 family RNA polymerase sigma factor [Phycisphaerae bacterium]